MSTFVRVSASVPRTWVPVSLLRFGEPVGKKIAFLSLNVVAALSAISANADDVVYKVRLESGAPQYYRLEVPPGISPAKVNPAEWNQAQYATNKISPNAAVLAAVGWAGGLEDHDPGYSNSLTNVGGKKPGGFYNASFIKVGDVQYRSVPFPNYLVHLNGQIGQSRQSFYADVLDDGRVVRPVAISGSEVRDSRKLDSPNTAEQWGGADAKMKWGGAAEKKSWGGAEEKKKWGGSGAKNDWGGAGQKTWGGAETKELSAAEQKKWGGSEEKTSN